MKKKKYEKEKTEVDSIIGTEIRLQRIKQRLTQQEVAYNICSCSYLCKIEKHEIVPKMKYLTEICARMNISKEDLNFLLNLKNSINECILAYWAKDYNKVREYAKIASKFDNYRAKMIMMLNALIDRDYSEAENLFSQFEKVITVMGTNDKIAAYIIASFYFSQIDEINNGRSYLYFAYDLVKDDMDVFPVVLELLMIFSLKTLSLRFLEFYEKYIEFCFEHGNYEKVDLCNYLKNVFYLLFDELTLVNYSVIKAANFRANLMILEAIKRNNLKIPDEAITSADDFYKLIAYSKVDVNKFNEVKDKIDFVDYGSCEYVFIEFLEKCANDNMSLEELDFYFNDSIHKGRLDIAKIFMEELKIKTLNQKEYKKFYLIQNGFDEKLKMYKE